MFKLHFGRLTGKAYTKGERVLRFEAIAHNTAELRCGRMIEKFAEIVTRLAGIAERFATALDCVDTGFLDDGILDRLPTGIPARRHPGRRGRCEQTAHARRPIGRARPRPGTERLHRRRVRRQGPRHDRHFRPDYTVRQAAYDLRKLRGKQLVDKPARTRRYRVPSLAARTIAALLTLRDQVIAPILAAVRSPRMGRKPAHWTRVDRDYERIRIDMQTLFSDLAIETSLAA